MRNKVVVVTGAASGLGKKIAEVFSEKRAITIIADLNFEKAKETSEYLRKKYSQEAYPIAIDVTKEEQVVKGIKEIVHKFGTIDVLINNAGIQHIDPINKFSYDNWKKILAVHLDGAFLMTRECLQIMYSGKKGGSIIFIGSVHSKLASRLKSAYVTAKHGLEGFCRSVAKEGAEYGVKSNLVCPGFVLTPLVEKQIPEQAKELKISEEKVIKEVMLKDTLDGEFTSEIDVANAVLFFAQQPNLALTGQSLIVSHGWFME